MPIKSPLNYTGNKYRILDQIQQHFPNHINVMVDLFCGGATVGLNTDCNTVYFVDSNIRVINLLSFLSTQNFNELLHKLENLINRFGLTNSYRNRYRNYRNECNNLQDNNGLKDVNYAGFYRLRDYYNGFRNKNCATANCVLYLLMIYGFNNDIRFNEEGNFNLPVGKTDLNTQNVNKLRDFINRCHLCDYHFICADFDSQEVRELVNIADFIYMDPPYLITDAVYNSFWSIAEEEKLLSFMNGLLDQNKNFALSNVISKVGNKNELLQSWIEAHDNVEVHDINYHYRSASYNKINRNSNEREILVSHRG